MYESYSYVCTNKIIMLLPGKIDFFPKEKNMLTQQIWKISSGTPSSNHVQGNYEDRIADITEVCYLLSCLSKTQLSYKRACYIFEVQEHKSSGIACPVSLTRRK